MSEPILLSTRSMREYCERCAVHFARIRQEGREPETYLGKLSVDRFADGEMEVTVHDSIRGKHVFLFANSAARNAHGIGVEESKIELYHAIDAIKRSQPAKLTVFEPFISSSRSDRATRRNSVGLWVHMKTMNSLGADHVITYQLHSDKSKSMMDPTQCSFEDIPATSLLKRYICDSFVKTREKLDGEVRDEWLFCSVDAGGEKLAKKFATAFDAQLVIAHKQRDYHRANTVESVNILSAVPIDGKVVWITDDMIDTGGSVYTLVKEMRKHDLREINIACVHPVFSPPALSRLKALHDEGLLKRVVAVDTIPCPESMKATLPCLEIVSSAHMSAEIAFAIHGNRSLSRFFDPFHALEYLSEPNLFSRS